MELTTVLAYGPTPGNPQPHWYELSPAFAGDELRLTFTDGATGDHDLAANGAITTIYAPAYLVPPGPALTLLSTTTRLTDEIDIIEVNGQVMLATNPVQRVTSEPVFVDLSGGNLRLQSYSPCINAGNNSYATNATDLDGNSRIVSVTVDIGAFEYQGTGSVISYAWLQQYGLPTDGSADLTDLDLDDADNYQEWMADTVPNNAASFLHLTMNSNSLPVAVTFASSAARLYTLLCCTNLTPSSVWTPVSGQTDLPGNGGALTLADTNAPPTGFYRVSVRF